MSNPSLLDLGILLNLRPIDKKFNANIFIDIPENEFGLDLGKMGSYFVCIGIYDQLTGPCYQTRVQSLFSSSNL